jgi:POT family proton-dependent oligopeptide transporter
VFACIYLVGLLILTCSSIPAAIENGAAFPGFVVALIIIGFGTGGIKSNVSPLVAEQYQHSKPYVRTLKNGDRVIVSPQATYQKLFNMFYWGINCGSLAAVSTPIIEKNVGFWAAFLLPTCVFIPGIVLVIVGKGWYVQTPPRGSVFFEVATVMRMAIKHGSLEKCKPSMMQEKDEKVSWDDVFVDELRRTFRACVVFCWFPLYWLCYSQMTNNLVSMVATTQTGSVPNDIMQNINPMTLVICIPVMVSRGGRVKYRGLKINFIYPFFRIAWSTPDFDDWDSP